MLRYLVAGNLNFDMKVYTRPTVDVSFSPLVIWCSIDGSINLEMLKPTVECIPNIEATVVCCHRVRRVKNSVNFKWVRLCLKETPCMLAGLVRSRDGSRDDTGTHFMNLPSPNVQSEVNVKTFILNITIHTDILQYCTSNISLCQIGSILCFTPISTNSVHGYITLGCLEWWSL
jgi:hypothetical protein